MLFDLFLAWFYYVKDIMCTSQYEMYEFIEVIIL